MYLGANDCRFSSNVDCVGNVKSPKSLDRESHFCHMQVINKIGIRLTNFTVLFFLMTWGLPISASLGLCVDLDDC